jgi:hypothetical protein
MPIIWRTVTEEKLAELDEKIAEAKKRRLEDEDNGAVQCKSSSQYYNEQIRGSRVRVCVSPRRKAEAMQLARDISADLRALRNPTMKLKTYTTRETVETDESEREREKNLSGGEINALSLSWIPEMELGQGDATYSITQKTNILLALGLSGPAGFQPCSDDGLDFPLSVGDIVTL